MQAFLDIFDIYLLEAVVNGILLGGVLALLALGLNLIFGVIDVTWICYAELVMIGMYGMYYLVQVFGVPYWAAAPLTILLVAFLGAALHYIVIAPLLTQPRTCSLPHRRFCTCAEASVLGSSSRWSRKSL